MGMPGPAPDLGRFAQRAGPTRALVADVRGVDPATRRHDPAQLDQLVGRRVSGRRVVETGVQPDRTRVEPLAEDRPSSAPARASSGGARIPAQDGEADRLVRRHRHHVDRRDALEAGRGRPRPCGQSGSKSAWPSANTVERHSSALGPGGSGAQPNPSGLGEVRGHALEDGAVAVVVAAQRGLGVDMAVDEAGRDHPLGGIDRVRGARASGRSPTATIRSPRTPTSARNPGAPVPSTTRPPVISRSRSMPGSARRPRSMRATRCPGRFTLLKVMEPSMKRDCIRAP